MAVEIERKFLVKDEGWRLGAQGVCYRQGYLNRAKERTVRVRTVGDRGFLAIKGEPTGATRLEFEYEIPLGDALELLSSLCEQPLIEKRRYEVQVEGLTWEVDEFLGENEGLVVAEVELRDAAQTFTKPSWAGEEVTSDAKYFNSSLVEKPFKTW